MSTFEESRRPQVKLFLEAGDIPHDALIRIFHDWVKQQVFSGELLVDVADYAHVHGGPAVLLVGHGGDWALDPSGGLGLLVTRKRGDETTLAARLSVALDLALDAVQRLEGDARLAGVQFSTKRAEVRILDRLNAPNDAETRRLGAGLVERVFARDGRAVSVSAEEPRDLREAVRFHVSLGT